MSQFTYNSSNNSQGVSAADLRTKMFYIVKETSAGVDVCGDGVRPSGILINTPNTNEIAEFISVGPGAKVKLYTTVTKGQVLSSYTGGLAQPIGVGHWMIGFAKEDGVANDIIEIDVHIGYYA